MTKTLPYAEVIGDPIAHSKSPLIHKFWLKENGIEGDYRLAHITPDRLESYISDRKADAHWRGCNVTIPHKVSVMDHVTDPGGVRDTIGAMNTIIRQPDGELVGTNTDAAGFYAPISEVNLEGAPVVVIGAGGASRAVLFALARAGVGEVTILNRSPLRAMGLLSIFGLKGKVLALDAALPPAALLVNSSSLGMKGQPPLELDLSPLPEDAIVYDLVYSPLETGLMKAASQRGLSAIGGLDMLIGQAAMAFELFYGAPPPQDKDDELRAILTA